MATYMKRMAAGAFALFAALGLTLAFGAAQPQQAWADTGNEQADTSIVYGSAWDGAGTSASSLPEAFTAASQLDSANKIVSINGECTLNENATIPDGVYLEIKGGGKLTLADGVTLTVGVNSKRLRVNGTVDQIVAGNNAKVLLKIGGQTSTNPFNGFVAINPAPEKLPSWLAAENGGLLYMKGQNILAIQQVNKEEAAAGLTRLDGSTMYVSEDQLSLLPLNSGGTLTLYKDLEWSIFCTDLTIDLGGNTLTGSKIFAIWPSGQTVIKNGTVKPGGMSKGAVCLDADASVTIASDAVIDARVDGGANNSPYGVGFTTAGGGQKLEVYGQVLANKHYAITGNGTGADNTELSIYDGAVVDAGSDYAAVYNPQIGTVNVLGGTVKGATGIEMRSGTLNVSGGTIEATASEFSTGGNESGATSRGAAVAVVQHVTKHPITVNVTGGILKGAAALGEANPQNNDAEALKTIDINISDGTFNGVVTVPNAASLKDGAQIVTGGIFSDTSALPYAGDNVALKTNDGFMVMTRKEAQESGAVASVETKNGIVYFTTVQDANEFVGDGEEQVAEITYTVSFNLGEGVEGAVPNSQIVKATGSATEVKDPVREGYKFLGWYLDDEPYDFTSGVKSDITLTAKWTEIFDVTFKSDNGEKDVVVPVVNGEKVAAPANPAREGYRFDGWMLNDKAYDFDAPVASDLELVAKWVKIYKVTFQFGNGADDLVVTVDENGVVAAPEEPTLNGWTFAGWFTKMIDEDTIDPESKFDFKTPVTEDITLYGGWIEDEQKSEVPVVEPEDKPAPDPDGGKLVQTGDASVLMMAASGIAGAAAIAAGYVASKRRK